MLKVLSIAGGLAGAVGLSQYPEFSQQYTQRLGGQVDALSQVVADFEASALRSGLTRTQAFDQMTGTPFLDARQADMRRTFMRHVVLSNHLVQLQNATALQRLTMPQRLLDRETLTRTWGDFAPAVPLTTAGIVSAGVGFLGGWAILVLIIAFFKSVIRRRPSKRDVVQMPRKEPQVARKAPRLIGETKWREP